MAVINDKLSGMTSRSIQEKYDIKNRTQIDTWVRWFKNNETNRLSQPIGKQYAYGKGPNTEELSDLQKLKMKNKELEEELYVLKKLIFPERR